VLLEKKSVKQRVLEILKRAMYDHMILRRGHVFYANQVIYIKDGWVPQSVFANPSITGSTEGKRRLRELRADPELQKKYRFEMKNEGKRWSYRIVPRDNEPYFRLRLKFEKEETKRDPLRQAEVDYVQATIANLEELGRKGS
jgi:hypothetical protein